MAFKMKKKNLGVELDPPDGVDVRPVAVHDRNREP